MGKGKSFLKWMKGRMMGRYHIWDISGGRESESERKYDESESEFVKGRMMGRYIRKGRKWKWERMLGIYIRPQGKWKWEKIWWKWEWMCERENDGKIYQEGGQEHQFVQSKKSRCTRVHFNKTTIQMGSFYMRHLNLRKNWDIINNV